ncbi:MAG: VWA domain-containing protein [Alphaproteobacteria bacterium]|nr:VWA domain-containing protein [Alphaproteobacteria bacterium]MBV9063102.1 VWA domain-containing protein [Alphaproteobacteria bacterium]
MANLPVQRSSSKDIAAFLHKAARTPTLAQVKGRLIFAVDATMSRQPTWDAATEIQGDMFEVAQSIGGLGVQLVYFRGRGEFEASEWTTTPSALAMRMRNVRTRSGFTQLRRVLHHAAEEARRTKVSALVYVGDCFEEDPEVVAKEAGALALLGVPAFMFHEADDPNAASMFHEVARLTHGVYLRFDSGAAKQLRDLLKAAAVYAAGGGSALNRFAELTGGEALRLARSIGTKAE